MPDSAKPIQDAQQRSREKLAEALSRVAKGPRLASIGIQISDCDEYIHWTDRRTVADFDVVIARPHLNDFHFQTGILGEQNDRTVSGNRFSQACAHWDAEWPAYFASGKTLVVLASDIQDITVYHGNSSYTFPNTRLVGILPWVGTRPLVADKLVETPQSRDLFRNHDILKQSLRGSHTIEIEHGVPLLTTNDQSGRLFGARVQIGLGQAIIIPGMGDDTTPYPELAHPNVHKRVADADLRKRRQALRSFALSVGHRTQKAPVPEWAMDKFWSTVREGVLVSRLAGLGEQREELRKQAEEVTEEFEAVRGMRALLYATGPELEHVVRIALRSFGLSAFTFNDGHDEIDICFDLNGERFVCEVEGKNSKAIELSKYRQLSDLYLSEQARQGEHVRVRGILFGNGHRTIPPSQRPDTFTQHVVSNAEKNDDIALIDTVDLYAAWKAVSEGTLSAEYIHQRLLSHKGGILVLCD